MATYPTFRRTGKKDLTLIRREVPTYVEGVLTQELLGSVVIKANIQPLTASNNTIFLTDKASVKRVVMVWSTSEIRQKIENGSKRQQADRFIWEDELYEVKRCVHYGMGVLSHYEALAEVVDPE